jgi:hypothetical protein
MAWQGPDQQNQCRVTDLAKLPSHSYAADDSEIKDTPQGDGLRGFYLHGRRPKDAIAGEWDDLDEADRRDQSSDRMSEFYEEYGGYGKPPKGQDF